MTAQEHIDFAHKQIAWHIGQIEWARLQIAWCNDRLKRTRKDDAELKAYAMADRPDDPMTARIFGGKYVGTETRKLMNERARYYRDIKSGERWIAKYRKQISDFSRYL